MVHSGIDENHTETIRHFDPTPKIIYNIHSTNESIVGLWLAAYIGNYIGNCLNYLNDFLDRVEIEPETQGINTKLLVKWEKVAATLGGLIAFQVVFGLAALVYCRWNFEIVDDVSTFSSMFTGFPFRSKERQQEDAVYRGKFVTEGDGFRWEFSEATGKDSEVV